MKSTTSKLERRSQEQNADSSSSDDFSSCFYDKSYSYCTSTCVWVCQCYSFCTNSFANLFCKLVDGDFIHPVINRKRKKDSSRLRNSTPSGHCWISVHSGILHAWKAKRATTPRHATRCLWAGAGSSQEYAEAEWDRANETVHLFKYLSKSVASTFFNVWHCFEFGFRKDLTGLKGHK